MLFASRSNFDAETELRRLREDLDTRLENLRSEWRQFRLEVEDTLDKIDHITKRNRKRQSRESPPPDSAPEEPEVDQISARVRERRMARGISA